MLATSCPTSSGILLSLSFHTESPVKHTWHQRNLTVATVLPFFCRFFPNNHTAFIHVTQAIYFCFISQSAFPNSLSILKFCISNISEIFHICLEHILGCKQSFVTYVSIHRHFWASPELFCCRAALLVERRAIIHGNTTHQIASRSGTFFSFTPFQIHKDHNHSYHYTLTS